MVYRLTLQGVAPANLVLHQPHPDALRAALVNLVKAEAGCRILAVAPAWKQSNATARAVELIRKGEANWTADEAAEAAAIDALWESIKDIRTQSDAIESRIQAAEPTELQTFTLAALWETPT